MALTGGGHVYAAPDFADLIGAREHRSADLRDGNFPPPGRRVGAPLNVATPSTSPHRAAWYSASET